MAPITDYPSKPLRSIKAEEIETYKRDGAIVLRDIIPLVWVERMQRAVDEVMANPGAMDFEMQAEGKSGRFFSSLFTWLVQDDFKALALSSPLGEIASQIMESTRVNYFYDQLLVKEPNTFAATPWHQDLPYWSVLGEDIVSIWVPLDVVNVDNGSVKYIKGSHLWEDDYETVSFSENYKMEEKGGERKQAIDYGADPERYPQLAWDLGLGDVLVHHSRTMHSAEGNGHPTNRRRAIATRWTGDDATFNPQQGTITELELVKPYIPDPELQLGDPMGGPLFPQVWPK